MSGRGIYPSFVGAVTGIVGGVLLAGASLVHADTNLGTIEGQTYISNSVSSAPAGTGVTIVAHCPAGSHDIGGGAYQSSGSNTGLLNAIFPIDGPDAGTVPDNGFAARFYSRTDGTVIRSAYAICVGGTRPTYVARDGSVSDEGTLAGRSAVCPPGTHVSDGGIRVFAGAATAEIKSSNPVDGGDADTIPDDGWRARVLDTSGGTVDFRVVAICRSSMPLYVSESRPIAPDTFIAGHASACATASPPAPVMGGGFHITGDPARIHATTTGPRASPGYVGESWIVYTDSAASASPGTVFYYGVCKP